MAGGSYSQMPIPEEPTRASIPARSTRQLPMMGESGERDEQEQVTRFLPELHLRRGREGGGGTEEHVTRFLPELHPGMVVHTFKEHPLTRHHPWLKRVMISMMLVVVGAVVLIGAGIFQRTGNSYLVAFPDGQSFPIQVGGSINNLNTWLNSNEPLPTKNPLPAHLGPYSVLGKPTISVDFMNQVMASYNSPAAGKGQTLYDLGVKYGVDPAFALAFFLHESTMGTAGEARTTHSLGNLRCIPTRPCIDQNRGGYAQMYSWEDGFEQWFKLIRNLYVAKWGLVTVDQIIPTYAPNSDNNNEQGYIAALKHYIDTWHAGIIRP